MSPRPPLIRFDGLNEQDAFRKARGEFDRLYRSVPIVDALGNEVVFPGKACHHVCYKGDEVDGDPKASRDVWRPDRAAHIPWISVILSTPWEVRPNKVVGRLSYFLQYPADRDAGFHGEAIYFAIVEPDKAKRTATFVTAFPVLKRNYWNEARKVGACLYPPEKVPKNSARTKA